MTGRSQIRIWVKAAGRLPQLARTALRAWRTLEPSDWSSLADNWTATWADFPEHPTRLQVLARLLRSARRLDEAIAVGRRLLELAPDNSGVVLELGRALRAAGHRSDAIATLRAAALAGESRAEGELLRYGARSHLPARAGSVFAPEDYASFIACCPPPAPPPCDATIRFGVTVAGNATQRATTLASLQQQSYDRWHLDTVAEDAALDLPPGALLDRHALAWLAWAMQSTGCREVRADHDHVDDGGQRCEPVLLPAPDFLWTEGPHGIVRLRATIDSKAGPVAHVPLVLMSIPRTADSVLAQPVPDAAPQPLSVIIPTRDNPELLRTAVESLLSHAREPDLIELIIVDNGSQDPRSRETLSRLAERRATSILPFPEPFNWSRANNLAARIATGRSLLFLNDDTAMLTTGWDRILAGLWADPAVGLIGTRLVYPDGSIQHGGFVFGMDNGPQHEGRWRGIDDDGPAGRWRAVRQSAGVTGAFIAIRREDFEALGGFDETAFAVDFSDLDLCLRVRAVGKAVVYCGAISLLHRESHSRGLNLGRVKRRRMGGETAAFLERWGELATEDPWYHPAWTRVGCSFDGLRPLSAAEVVGSIRIGRAFGAS